MLTRIVIVIYLALLQGITSAPQRSAGTIRISGRVVDPINLPLPKASVLLTSLQSDKSTSMIRANDQGNFTFDSVQPGSYSIRIDNPGFLSRKLTLTRPETDRDVNLGSIVLKIGAVTEGPITPEKRSKEQKPITVCESLANPTKLNHKPVAIIGRIECGASLIDHVCFLVQEGCKRSNSSRPTKIMIVDFWEEGMRQPPSTLPGIDTDALMRKLSEVRKSTTLGMHQEPRFKTDGASVRFSHLANVPDQWGLAYGLFLTAPCADKNGCDGFGDASVALITLPYSLRIVTSDGKVTSPDR